MMDEKGQIAVDFLLGISLFLIALIFIVQFIPGLFLSGSAGESSLDYTAYRTAAILAEDTGWWGNSTSSGTAWEAHPDNVMRIGLAVDHEPESKLTNTPNLLSKDKIERFMVLNGSNIIEMLGLYNNVDGTHFSYGYNISISQITQNNTPLVLNNTPITLGEATPHDRESSKITRIVLVDIEKEIEAQIEADELTIPSEEDDDEDDDEDEEDEEEFEEGDPVLSITGPLNNKMKLQISNLSITGDDPSFEKLMRDGVQLNEGSDYISYQLVNGTMIPLTSTGEITSSDIVVFCIEPGIFNENRIYELKIDLKDISFIESGRPPLDLNQYIKTISAYEPAYLTVEVWN